MKPAEAVGLIREKRRFGRSKILEHRGGRVFLCESLDRYPGVRYTTSWYNLRRS
jgi:hypothetical protein